jgi:serine/threonine protein kinase
MEMFTELLGKEIKGFFVIENIGSGGMAQVYLALQRSLNRQVALKYIRKDPEKIEELQRFLREARLTASIHHPNIVSVYGIEEEEDYVFIVMEYVKGVNLKQFLEEKKTLPEREVWNYALHICKGLQAAFEVGVIHRDIKPSNILLSDQNIIKITDFGLSRKIDEDSYLTKEGAILGTPQFMSPEQICEGKSDFRSDIYSLGASLYYLFTSKPIFQGKSSVDIMIKHKLESPLSPQTYNPSLLLTTTAILGRMLAKNPSERYQSYQNVIVDIECWFLNKKLPFVNDPACFEVFSTSEMLNDPKSLSLQKDSLSLKTTQTYFEKVLQETKSSTGVKQSDFETLSLYSSQKTQFSQFLRQTFCDHLPSSSFTLSSDQKENLEEWFESLFQVENEEIFWKTQRKGSFFEICRLFQPQTLSLSFFNLQNLFSKKVLELYG